MRVVSPVAAPPAGAEPAAGAEAWAHAWARPAFRRSWLLLLALLFGVMVPLVPSFFHYIQQRPGVGLPDPLLALLPRHDVALPLFVLAWGGVVLGVGWLVCHPGLFLRGMWALLLLVGLRMATIWLVPLAPPPGLVPLIDPLLALLLHTKASEAITKDLFFSGHTAIAVLLALAVRGRWLRTLLGTMAVAVGLLVLVQRVHYTYDVLAAPLFAGLAYWAAQFIWRGRAEETVARTL